MTRQMRNKYLSHSSTINKCSFTKINFIYREISRVTAVEFFQFRATFVNENSLKIFLILKKDIKFNAFSHLKLKTLKNSKAERFALEVLLEAFP